MKKSKPSTIATKSSESKKLILGLDPGVARLGFACLCEDEGQLSVLDAGVFTTTPQALEYRLKLIFEFLQQLSQKYSFRCVAMEKVFFSKNAKTALSIEAVRGVLMLFGALQDIQVFQYTPLEIKKTLTMYGQASKHEVQLVAEGMLGHSLPASDDACDAVAVALCYHLSDGGPEYASRC
ncbi:MAG TPA: crossover junction endodeoxyribonuclease RuvC [Caldisericia bacterium]|jgi:crossover junction endodeoxyribonuclease RuvC|nr:crossover junction endodeoxyribonuclease RuvC [Caldisericia bacterium]